MQRYIDKNIKARRKPVGTGVAFDAGTGASAEEVEDIYKKMLQAVQSEGGFGQHAVVLTSDSRYLGEGPLRVLVEKTPSIELTILCPLYRIRLA